MKNGFINYPLNLVCGNMQMKALTVLYTSTNCVTAGITQSLIQVIYCYCCIGQDQASIRKAGCCFFTCSVSTTASFPAFNYHWSSCSIALVLTCWASAFDLEDTENSKLNEYHMFTSEIFSRTTAIEWKTAISLKQIFCPIFWIVWSNRKAS